MGVVKPILQKSQKIFTQKDFEKGKCTKDGFPLGEAPIDEKPLVPENPVDPTDHSENPNVDAQGQPQTTGGEQPKEADGNVSDGSEPKQDGGE